MALLACSAVTLPVIHYYAKHDALSTAKQLIEKNTQRYAFFDTTKSSSEDGLTLSTETIVEHLNILPLFEMLEARQKSLPAAVSRDTGIQEFPCHRLCAFLESDFYTLLAIQARIASFIDKSNTLVVDLENLTDKLQTMMACLKNSPLYTQEAEKLLTMGEDAKPSGRVVISPELKKLKSNALCFLGGSLLAGAAAYIVQKSNKKAEHKYEFIKLLEHSYETTLDNGIAAYKANPLQPMRGFMANIFFVLHNPLQSLFIPTHPQQEALLDDLWKRAKEHGIELFK